MLVDIDRIRYFPYNQWTIASHYLHDAVFEGSVDGVSYTTLGEVDTTVHAGWNSFLVQNNNAYYRYIRMRHNATSQCRLSEFEVYGVLLNDLTVSSISSFSTNVIFDDGYNTKTFSNAVTYRQDKTPVITSINPATGSVYGG